MDIVICTDKNYVMPAGVLICSICENHKSDKIRFHVIGDKALTDEVKSLIKEQINTYHQEVSFYTINANNELSALLPVGLKGQSLHLTIAAYYRLFLSSILPISIEKVLYLDCDIIVRHNLNELWNTDIADYAIGSVTDQDEGSISKFNRLRYPQNLGYFNSGVLLINLTYWREKNLEEEYLDFLRKYPERALLFDQDVLNYVLREKKKTLPLKYNVQARFFCKQMNISWEYENELNEAISNPYIIHYVDRIKPWMKGCDHPFKSEFFKYRQLTKWKDFPLQKCKVKLSNRTRLKNFLSKFGIVSKVKLYDYRNDLKLLD